MEVPGPTKIHSLKNRLITDESVHVVLLNGAGPV